MRMPLELRINPLDKKEYLAVEIPTVLAKPTITRQKEPDKYEERHKLYEKAIVVGEDPDKIKTYLTQNKSWMPADDVKSLDLVRARYSFPAIIRSTDQNGEIKDTFGHITLWKEISKSGRKIMYFPANLKKEINHNWSYGPFFVYPIIGSETVTIPGKTIIVETIRVKHLNHIYPHNVEHPPIQKIGGRWIWFIPNELTYIPPGQLSEILHPYVMFSNFIKRNFPLQAEVLSDGGAGEVIIDIGLLPPNRGELAKEIASANGIAYRTMSNNNYSLKDEGEYPFYAEIRASWLACYPRTYYIPQEKRSENPDVTTPMKLKIIEQQNNLTITVFNMAHWVFAHEYPDGYIARPWRSEKIRLYHERRTPKWNRNWKIEDFPRNMVDFSKRSGTRRGGTSSEDVQTPNVISEGMEINSPVTTALFRDFPFEKVIKYVRFINASNKYYVYNDFQINEKAKTKYTYVDKEGFIWETAAGRAKG